MGATLDGTTMGVDKYFQSDAADALRQEQASPASIESDGEDQYDAPAPQVDIAKIRRALLPIPGGGKLLEEPAPRRIFRSIDREVDSQEPLARNRHEQQKHWSFVLDGSQLSVLDKTEDQSTYRQLFPPGAEESALPIPNKVADLKRKIVAQVLVDPFLPMPKPRDADTERNRAAADLMKKFLRMNGGPHGTNDDAMGVELLNINMVGKSAFVWVRTDKTGGGWRPMRKYAHPHATDPRQPMLGPKLDPATNAPMTKPDGSPVLERTSDPVLRFVAEGGERFTTNPAAAERQWMPKIGRTILPPNQVRTVPPTKDVTNANKIILIAWNMWGEAKRWFPVLKTLTKEQAKSACTWRPKRWRDIVPEMLQKRGGSIEVTSDGDISDNSLFFWYHEYCRHSEEYPDGADIAINGAKNGAILLRRDTLREDVELDDGTTVPILLSMPIAQFKALDDPKNGDAFGKGPVEDFGSPNETLTHLYMGALEAIHKGLNPLAFIPSTSPVTREDMMRRDGTPIPILTPEDKPSYEQTPQLPAWTPQLIEKVEMGMNSAAGTNETSNGLDSSYSDSGVAKEVSIAQAKVTLAPIWKNMRNGYIQFWTIVGQQAQAYLTVPGELTVGGSETAFKQRWFVGADLVGEMDFVHQPGTGTMMGPMQRLQMLSMMQGGQWIDTDRAGELARTTMADDLGLDPDPHEEFIDRQRGDWLEGPPPGWDEAYAANQKATADHQTATQQQVAVLTQQGVDLQTAQQQVAQQIPAPTLQPLYTPFDPRPNDQEPGVAKIRVKKLSLTISTTDYTRFSPAWQKLLADAYTAAFSAAGGQTVQQQSQASETQKATQAATKFLADVQAKTLAIIETDIAKDAAGQNESGSAAVASATPPGADPAELAADAQNTQAKIAADRAKQQEQLQATAIENQRDREHEATQNAADRAAKLHESVFQSVLGHHTQLKTAKAKAAAKPRQPAISS